MEGYGQSELVAPCTLTFQGDWVPEHVGPPLPCVQIKLVDVPEMEYYASVGQGEICVRGSTVFQVPSLSFFYPNFNATFDRSVVFICICPSPRDTFRMYRGPRTL